MTKLFLKLFFPFLAGAVLGYVWAVSISGNGGLPATFNSADPAGTLYALFRLAGLTAFTLVSFQILTGPYMKFWEKLYGPSFYRWHGYQGLFAFLFAIIHPSLLLSYVLYEHLNYFEFAKHFSWHYWLGPIALILLVCTVGTAALSVLFNKQKFQKSWHWIHFANYLVFLLVFVHSINIGTDVAPPNSALRPLWWFFFAGMIVGLVYRRVYRPFLERKLKEQPLETSKSIRK